MTTVNSIVEEHLRAARKLRESLKRSPTKAKRFLVSAGIADKKGARLAKRYR